MYASLEIYNSLIRISISFVCKCRRRVSWFWGTIYVAWINNQGANENYCASTMNFIEWTARLKKAIFYPI